jgi:hypothetical protein
MFDRNAAPNLPGRHIFLPTSLVVRRSTARPHSRFNE